MSCDHSLRVYQNGTQVAQYDLSDTTYHLLELPKWQVNVKSNKEIFEGFVSKKNGQMQIFSGKKINIKLNDSSESYVIDEIWL